VGRAGGPLMDITAIPGLLVDLVRYLVQILFLSPSTL
jgi:hypothetical protein